MDLKTYINAEHGRLTELARSLVVSRSYLSQMASGRAAIAPARCVDIERATAGEVTRPDLRPDDWERIWPELRAPGQPQPERRKDDRRAAPAPQAAGATEVHR